MAATDKGCANVTGADALSLAISPVWSRRERTVTTKRQNMMSNKSNVGFENDFCSLSELSSPFALSLSVVNECDRQMKR